MRRLRLGLDNTSLVGHQDGVDDVDDTVGLEDIGCGDGGCAAFGVGEDDVAAGHGGGEVFTLNGLKSGFAAALFDHGCELPGADAASNDMVGKDLDEGIFVFRLDECFDCAGGEFGEGIVSRRKDGEGSRAVERVDQTGGFDCCDKGLVDRRVDGVLDDGFGGIHLGTAYCWVFLCVCGERGDGHSSYGQSGEECLLHLSLSFIVRESQKACPAFRVHKHLRPVAETGLVLSMRCVGDFFWRGRRVIVVTRTEND